MTGMYRFRVGFELSDERIRQYIRIYENKKDWLLTIFFTVLTVAFIVYVFVGDWLDTMFLKGSAAIAAVIAFLFLIIIFKTLRRTLLFRKPPFGIGHYLALEMRDGFFNVNSSGSIKGFAKGELKQKKLKNGDILLTQGRDMIFIPKDVITPNLQEDLKGFFRE